MTYYFGKAQKDDSTAEEPLRSNIVLSRATRLLGLLVLETDRKPFNATTVALLSCIGHRSAQFVRSSIEKNRS